MSKHPETTIRTDGLRPAKPPTGVRRVGKKKKMRLREIEGDAPFEMPGDGPPPKIQVARVVPRDQHVLRRLRTRHIEAEL